MKTLIVGANGRVGTLLSGKMWAAHDFSPVALIRDSRQQTKFTALGLPSAVGDLEAGIADFLQGMDDIPGGGKIVRAEVPLAEMFGYSAAVRSVSQGRASFTMAPLKYGPASAETAESFV